MKSITFSGFVLILYFSLIEIVSLVILFIDIKYIYLTISVSVYYLFVLVTISYVLTSNNKRSAKYKAAEEHGYHVAGDDLK